MRPLAIALFVVFPIIANEPPAGFTAIFNGKDLSGWAGDLDGYEVKGGVLINKAGKSGNLFTKAEYGDFTVRLEYKMSPGGNNGLAIRSPGKGQASTQAMCEVQILHNDSTKHAKIDPRQTNGSVYGMIAAERGHDRPVGEWNRMQVTVEKHRIEVELNGKVIASGDVSKVTKFLNDTPHPGKDRLRGHFGFAGHGDAVEFRNIHIKGTPVVE